MSLLLNLLSLILVIATIPGTIYLALIVIFGFNGVKRLDEEFDDPCRSCTGLAILIPAHNEEAVIPNTLSALAKLQRPECRVDTYVVADNCTDGTATIAQGRGCTVLPRINEKLIGKGHALDFGFKEILSRDYDLVFVIDADTVCSDTTLTELVYRYERGQDVIQATNTIIPDNNNPYSQLTNLGFYAMNVLRPMARREMGFSAGIFGTGFALSSDVLKQCPYEAFSLVEDVQYHHLLIMNNFKSHLSRTAMVFSEVPSYSSAAESQRNRWEGGKIQLLLDYFFPLLNHLLRGERRFIDPLLELTLLPISFHLILITLSVALSSASFFLIVYLAINLILLFCYTALAWSLSGSNKPLWTLLLLLPKYFIWKLRIAGGLIQNIKSGARWIRTKRD